MYFADLTPYEYFENKELALNIGWLDLEHKFTQGEVPNGFIERLKSLTQVSINQTRGFHYCPFCRGKNVGSAEIRVRGKDGRFYAAPTLICHYVEVHRYQPPQEFIEAVMESR